jgi:hypothetical protein
MADSPSSNDQPNQPEPSEGGCRPSFYMSTELLAEIDAQSATDGKKRSPFLAEMMDLLLMSPTGQKLRESASAHKRPLVNELEAHLIWFNEHIPTEKIEELAEASQRYPDQMLVRLVLLGLRVYERAMARMDSDIEGS